MSPRTHAASGLLCSLPALAIASLALAGCLNQRGQTDTSAQVNADPLRLEERGFDAEALAVLLTTKPWANNNNNERCNGGTDSFAAFRCDFLRAVDEGRIEDYVENIRFPLQEIRYETTYSDSTIGASRRMTRRMVSRGNFTPFIVYEPQAYSQTVYDLQHTFSGPNTRAVYRGERMLVFAPVDGSWVLTAAGLCINSGECPETLLCAETEPPPNFPGRGPDGTEDFHAFFKAFYCLSNAETYRNSVEDPEEILLTRINHPFITERRYFNGYDLFARDGGAGPPEIQVDGDQAAVMVASMASDHEGALDFKRIDGLWYLVER